MHRREMIKAMTALTIAPFAYSLAAETQFFFAGCFHDTGGGPGSQIRKFLIEPARRRGKMKADNPAGAEMTPAAKEVLEGRVVQLSGAGLKVSTTEKDGNALVLGVTRAQHEVATVQAPGVPDEFLIVVSITVSLDVLTDRAAMSNGSRFEILYATMQVDNQVIQQRTPPTDAELEEHYLRLFKSSVEGVLDQFQSDHGMERDRAKAVFQVRKFGLAHPLQPAIAPLLDGAITADASNGVTGAEEAERERLERELMHITTAFLRKALADAGRKDIALMPAPSSWTRSRVLSVLQDRLGYGNEIPSQPDPSKMNGYEIWSGILSATPTVAQQEAYGKVIQLNAQMASKIVRNKEGAAPIHVPSSVTDAKAKFAQGFGFRTYNEVVGITRTATRDVMMGSLRDAAKDMAKPLLALMDKVAAEIN